MYFIGIDLGTSSMKLLLMDYDGKKINSVSLPYPLHFPRPGFSEQNPSDWISALKTGIRGLIQGLDKNNIKAIGVGGQMHGLVALDKNDNVIRPAILWNDGRTVEETEFLNETIGKERISHLTGNIAFAGFTAPKILWLKKNEPKNFEKIRKIMLPKDYINFYLTGNFVTDYSDACGTLLLDVEHKKWSDEMLSICGISKDMMPELHESFDSIGLIRKEVSDELELPENVVVAAGAGDNAAAAIGTGVVGQGGMNISLGTSGTIFISSDKFIFDETHALHSFNHADGGYTLMGCMLSAASCNKWWMENILNTEKYDMERNRIAPEKLGMNHVYFLPYLMGERSPYNDAYARACFIGLSMENSRTDMTLAVHEGVAFAIRDMYERALASGIKIEKSMICGGGARSKLWKKIVSNVLGITLESPESEEGPSLGGAILAGVAEGEYSNVKEVSKEFLKISSVTEPDEDLVNKYDEKYQVYKKLYPALKDVFPSISGVK